MILEKVEKNPNPTKDQHFMVDQNMLEQIYDSANIQEGESIVEIGGGSGALTDYLVRGNNHVTVIEKDPYYASLLKKKYTEISNVTVIEGDALQFDYQNYDRLVANLPYTITEPFLINLARTGALNYNPSNTKESKLKSITLVLSQNSTRKMVAPVQITDGNSKHLNQEFGIMGAICKSFCDLEIVTSIPSECFYPEPAVTSFLVNLTPKKEKTTVDRIMRALLEDRKMTLPSIKKTYQLMLLRGELYKINKHKKDSSRLLGKSFTSKTIENENIYNLSHAQISQLVQDLIRNDISIKSGNQRQRYNKNELDYSQYFVGGNFIYNPDDFLEDEYEEDAFEEQINRGKEKIKKKYEYMYDSKKYDVLLHRGLEYVDSQELQEMLGQKKNHKGNSYTKKR